MSRISIVGCFVLILTLGSGETISTEEQPELTYPQGSEFTGKISRTRKESEPAWPQRPRPPEGAPNVLIWLLDDAGFAHLEPYGGQVATPTVERLAEEGLVFTDFHSPPLCSPARAALLTGRNHHSVGMGSHIMSPAGFPGYNGRIPASAASLARVLQDRGYATFALGKWDQTPVTEAGPSGPFDSWPSGQGFDHFYGFIGGDAEHFSPSLWDGHTPISPAENNSNYFLTTDLADKAIEYIGNLHSTRPGTPFFLYWSTGAVHAPHHAPSEYIERFRGQFDSGWDAARNEIFQRQKERGVMPNHADLSARPKEIPAWDSLSDKERQLFARQMEAFAGQLNHTDEEFGRIIEFLRQINQLDNTVVVVLSDNGASAEGGMTGLHNEALSFNSVTSSFEQNYRFLEDWGGPNTVNHFHAGWALAGNTPLPYFKHHVDEGGTRVPMVIRWPRAIAPEQSGLRHQYHHIIDVMPTVLKLAGIELPQKVDGVTQQPLEGIDLSYVFEDANAPDQRTEQYYEVWGNRGMYSKGWLATTIHNNIMPWQRPVPGELEADVWRLYNLEEDPAAAHNVADRFPDKLKELKELWEQEAARHKVFPLDPNRRARFIASMNRSAPGGNTFVYPGQGAFRIPEALSPPVKHKSHSITIELASAPVDGVLVAAGGVTGGYTIYIQEGVLHYSYNLYNEQHFTVSSPAPLAPGVRHLELRFDKNAQDSGGIASLIVAGELVASTTIPTTVQNSFSITDGFDIGRDSGSSVVPVYRAPNIYQGRISRVEVQILQ